jgi:serine/threonine protein kinase
MRDDGRPCLADFGLTVISDMTISQGTSTTSNVAGAARWLAPELLIGNKTTARKTSAGDVFAFGRLCLAVRSRSHPFPLLDSSL